MLKFYLPVMIPWTKFHKLQLKIYLVNNHIVHMISFLIYKRQLNGLKKYKIRGVRQLKLNDLLKLYTFIEFAFRKWKFRPLFISFKYNDTEFSPVVVAMTIIIFIITTSFLMASSRRQKNA